MGRLVVGLFSLVILAVIAAIGVYAWIGAQFSAAIPRDQAVTVMIEKGNSVSTIADKLNDAALIQDPLVFRIGFRLFAQDETLKAGEYLFEPGHTPEQILAKLIAGDVVVYKLTVPEGLTSSAIIRLVSNASDLTGEPPDTPPEGTLLPETYHFERGESRSDLVARMMNDMSETMETLWPQRASDLPIKTPEQAIILASVVERETALADEKPHVAGVFVNRLRLGMRLQSDPTVIYGLSEGTGRLDRPLSRKDLETNHPYNTYVISGLPVGPIANPGRDSIAAVLNPMETEDLYFVADGTGGHAFAKSLREHNRNVAKWRKIQKELAGQ